MLLRSALLTSLCLICFTPALANDNQGWTAFSVTGPITEDGRFLVWFDAHARYRDDATDLDTTILRPGVGWKVSDDLSLWGGYARVTSHREGPNIEEDRIWQQATYKVSEILGGALSGRTRFEQRFRNTGSDTGLRLRQAFRWARPIEGTDWSYVLANETFIGLNDTDWGQESGYGQNRAFAGLAWKAASNVRLEAGYLNNHIDGAGGDRTNHNLSVALFFSLR